MIICLDMRTRVLGIIILNNVELVNMSKHDCYISLKQNIKIIILFNCVHKINYNPKL